MPRMCFLKQHAGSVITPRRRPEILSLRQHLENAIVILAAHAHHAVPPPVERDALIRDAKELGNGRDGDARGKGGREHKVVLNQQISILRCQVRHMPGAYL